VAKDKQPDPPDEPAEFLEEDLLPDPLEPVRLPVDADAPERRREPAAMRTLVSGALRRLNLSDQHLWQEELAAVWARLAPPAVAASARPGKWDRGVLYLFVPNSAKLFEIQRFHLRSFEASLRRHFGEKRLKQVRLMIDPGK
jgi:hypothetical protein